MQNLKKRTCSKCQFQAETPDKKCPHCGHVMTTQLSVRITGIILVVLGSSLAIFMASLFIWAKEMIDRAGTPGINARFNGTREEALMMFGLFGIVMFLGVAVTLGGIWQIIFARRNKIIIWIVLLGGLALIIAAVSFIVRS